MSKAKNVLLVHGEKLKMSVLRTRIEKELGLKCYDPANGQTVSIPTDLKIPASISAPVLEISYGGKINNACCEITNRLSTLKNASSKKDISASSFKKARLHIFLESEITEQIGNDDYILVKKNSDSAERLNMSISFNPFQFLTDVETSPELKDGASSNLGFIRERAFNTAYQILLKNLYVSCKKDLSNPSLPRIICGDNISVCVNDIECQFLIEFSSDSTEDAYNVMVILNKLNV